MRGFATGSRIAGILIAGILIAGIVIAGIVLVPAARADVQINEQYLSAGKPSLAHAPNGVLYAALEDLRLQWIYVYRSTDEGATWTYLTGVVGGPTGWDASNPSIACGIEYGGRTWVFVAYEALQPDQTRQIEVLEFDPDDIETADIVIVESGISGMSDDIHPEICTDSPPFVGDYSVYLTFNRRGGIDPANQVVFVRSDDRGLSWGHRQVLATESLMANERPHISFGGPLGFPGDAYRVMVTYEEALPFDPGWQNNIYVRDSHDFGNTWHPPVLIAGTTDDEYDARVAAAENSMSAVVVYTTNWNNSGDLDVRYAYSTDAGLTWTTDQWMAGSTQMEKGPSIAVVYDDRFHCAYWKEFDIFYTWADDATPTQWSSPVLVNTTHTASPIHPRPAVTTLLNVPEVREGCGAWTDFRNGQFDTFFSLMPPASSAVGDGIGGQKPDGLLVEMGAPYPNPVAGRGSVLLPMRLSRAATAYLQFYDASGRRAGRTEARRLGPSDDRAAVAWDLPPGLGPGVYFARLMTEHGPSGATARVVVQ